MRTVSEVSKLTGISVRALHYYDSIGLLPAAMVTDAGYRMYDDSALERLQQILLFKELQFPLKEIKQILDAPGFDRNKALEQQIHLLELRREHLDNLIDLARGIRLTGVKFMSFDAFDTKKIDEYARAAKESWGNTKEYKEFEQKNAGRSPEDMKDLGKQLMDVIAEIGALKERPAADPEVSMKVKKLQSFISEHYYQCSDEILAGLGLMYAGGGSMTDNIDAYCGEGTAEFANEAIQAMIAGKKQG